jgi:hypothetical protein
VRRLLIVSLDAVGDAVFAQMAARPRFAALLKESAVWRGVESVFPTNTYPIHASIVTGVMPARHGILGNTDPRPAKHPQWHYHERRIKAATLWQAAAKKGLCTAAVMWPVTGGAKSIRWNIPELMKLPGENQIALNLRYGSKWLQIAELMRHGHLVRGTSQPALDSFTTACMADILREKKPDLALAHLTAYDTLCHKYGPGAPELETAFDALDKNLGTLLDAAGDMDAIVFSDHAQLAVSAYIYPNELIPAGTSAFFECAGGSAFFYPGDMPAAGQEGTAASIKSLEGFARFLTAEEMACAGKADLPFGFCAKPGYVCENYAKNERGNHGYPTDWPDYKVFYAVRQKGREPSQHEGGSLLDIAPLAAGILGITEAMGF